MPEQNPQVRDLTPLEVAQGLQDGRFILVDVREPDETAIERFPEAVLVSLSSFDPAASGSRRSENPARGGQVLARQRIRAVDVRPFVLDTERQSTKRPMVDRERGCTVAQGGEAVSASAPVYLARAAHRLAPWRGAQPYMAADRPRSRHHAADARRARCKEACADDQTRPENSWPSAALETDRWP